LIMTSLASLTTQTAGSARSSRRRSGGQVRNAGEAATPDRRAGDDRKEELDEVHPARRRRGELQVDARILAEPGRDRGMGVGAVVVEHRVQLPPWIGPGHQLEEGEELGVAVARVALSMTRPVATSDAADSVVVPCRT
jgi:hypothetical protein